MSGPSNNTPTDPNPLLHLLVNPILVNTTTPVGESNPTNAATNNVADPPAKPAEVETSTPNALEEAANGKSGPSNDLAESSAPATGAAKPVDGKTPTLCPILD